MYEYFNIDLPKVFLPWRIAKNYIQGKDILDILDVKKLNIVLLNYLTYRYNYDRKFQGAKYNEKGNPTNKAAELRQKFEGQKPEDVIDGLFENWKLDNFTSLNDNAVKIFKQIIYMLSNYTYSKYAINKGYNDDVKLFSPYYFELISNPRELETGYWEFEHCKVKLNSSYFNFTGGYIPSIPINYWEDVYSNDKSFNNVDNKYYYVVWRGDKNAGWKIALFKFENTNVTNIDQYGKYIIQYSVKQGYNSGLMLVEKRNPGNVLIKRWEDDNKQEYFKSLYRWNNDSEPNTPFISPKTGRITELNLKEKNNIKKKMMILN
ncbi:hypothetical protein [Spiroplasma endosymbiont of Polydrusus cervinus]|uniref:hypothetical protein n=1 Tax=Spiroplasma endosymbiont of Polydrusus cervinus TaxID=3066287 RepID=UPI0030D2A350